MCPEYTKNTQRSLNKNNPILKWAGVWSFTGGHTRGEQHMERCSTNTKAQWGGLARPPKSLKLEGPTTSQVGTDAGRAAWHLDRTGGKTKWFYLFRGEDVGSSPGPSPGVDPAGHKAGVRTETARSAAAFLIPETGERAPIHRGAGG